MITCLGITSSGAGCTTAAFSEKRKSDNFDRLNLLLPNWAFCSLPNQYSVKFFFSNTSVALDIRRAWEKQPNCYLELWKEMSNLPQDRKYLPLPQICYIVVQNRGFQFAKGPKITLRNSNDWHWHIVPSDYCTDQKIVSFGLNCWFWWRFILGRCSFMSATKSVFICATHPLALLHSLLFRNEKRHRAEFVKLPRA